MSNWAALSSFLILVLHILQGKTILDFEETNVYYQSSQESSFMKIVTVNCWCAMRMYLFPCKLGIEQLNIGIKEVQFNRILIKINIKNSYQRNNACDGNINILERKGNKKYAKKIANGACSDRCGRRLKKRQAQILIMVSIKVFFYRGKKAENSNKYK